MTLQWKYEIQLVCDLVLRSAALVIFCTNQLFFSWCFSSVISKHLIKQEWRSLQFLDLVTVNTVCAQVLQRPGVGSRLHWLAEPGPFIPSSTYYQYTAFQCKWVFHKQTEEQHSSQQLVKTRIKQSIIALCLDCKKIGLRTHECEKNIKALVNCIVLLTFPSTTTGAQDASEEWLITRIVL